MKRFSMLLAVASLLTALLPAGSRADAHASQGAYGPYIGSWYVHGYTLTVTRGSALAVYRTYTWCSAQRHYGCDRIVGNAIYDGGIWWAELRQPGSTRDTGTIGAGADSSLLGASITLQRQPNSFLVLTIGTGPHAQHLTLCGSNVPASMRGQCGA